MSHFEVLKKLFPVRDMTGELDNDLTIEGKYMDQVDSTASQLALEFYPNTSTLLLSDWERVYDTTAVGDSSRQDAVETAMRVVVNKDGRLNPSYYVGLAAGLGYDSTVIESPDMFIVANTSPPATVLPGILYEITELYTWYLDSTGSTVPADRTSLMNLINDRVPAFTKVIYAWA
jgi:uncharacterized protein YmfQ (DUF2313 family)